MKPYANTDGDSGIAAYEIGLTWIDVKFKNTAKVYRYSHASAGQEHVENMKKLVERGNGLNAYINRYVRNDYE